MNDNKNILVRLPNWLGDAVMATAFISELSRVYPGSTIDVIVKKEISDIARHMENISSVYVFSKQEYPGLPGLYKFARKIKKEKKYHLFFSLPDSFSSAVIGFFSGSKARIGYQGDGRSFLLTHAFKKSRIQHRTEEYVHLLMKYGSLSPQGFKVALTLTPQLEPSSFLPSGKYMVLNVNSEAQSRRIPLEKAAELIHSMLHTFPYPVALTGSKKDMAYVNLLYERLADKERILNLAGKTSLEELLHLVKNSAAVVSTDSGIAHLTNAVGTKLVVLFGAGDENNTRPYNPENFKGVRELGFACAPCVSNTCQFGTPPCLLKMENGKVMELLKQLI